MISTHDRSQLRVSLVQMPRWSIRTPPFAIALLTGILRGQGFTVFPKDFDIEFYRRVDPTDCWAWTGEEPVDWGHPEAFGRVLEKYEHLFEEAAEEILADRPQVVGFSVKVWSLEFSREVARRIKRLAPEVFLVFGGPDTNKGPEEHWTVTPRSMRAVVRRPTFRCLPSWRVSRMLGCGRWLRSASRFGRRTGSMWTAE